MAARFYREMTMVDDPIRLDEAVLAEKVKDYRERTKARVTAIKRALIAWLEPHDDVADGVCITRALLELALDRHVAVHDADGFDLVESAYQRALERWRGPLQ
jgi:hypothetical protein